MKRIAVVQILMLIIVTVLSSITYAEDRVSLGFIYSTGDQTELVTRTNGAINQVSPVWFNLTSKGNLEISGINKTFISNMKEEGVKVIPFLSNHWSRSKGQAALKNADKLSDQIIAAIEKYELDGVNIDIENLLAKDKDRFSEFVRILREKLPEDKLLTVAVAANPYGVETGWQGSYDYEKLGEYSDYLFIMAYDESSIGSNCGPVASLPFVENSIKYALERVSKDKIVMGIPLYGRFWSDNGEYNGDAIVIGAVPNVISKYKGRVWYDSEYRSPVTMFTIKETSPVSRINGQELTPGNYTIWYENADSIKEKLALVNKYDILGSGVWALGQEKVDVWDYYYGELNKIPYKTEETIEVETRYASFVEAKVHEISMKSSPKIFNIKIEKEVKHYETNKHDHIEDGKFVITYIPVIGQVIISDKKIKGSKKDIAHLLEHKKMKII